MKSHSKPFIIFVAALIAFFGLLAAVSSIFADAGNPILGTIKGDLVTNPDGSVTVFVRGQWNWYSHNGDCNVDRAGTGVAIVWNDPNGGTPAKNERAQIAMTGTVTGGNFKLKVTANGSNQTTAAITAVGGSWTAAQVDSALEALSIVGPGNVNVTGGPLPGSPMQVEFVGALAGKNVALTLASKSLTGSGTNMSVTTTQDGAPAAYNGYPLTGSGGTFYVGTKNATTLNPADGVVHPVDIGNDAEGYAGRAGQVFGNPTPVAEENVTAAQVAAFRAGCGREPLTATAPNQPGALETTGKTCGDATLACSGHPWGSWGYEVNSGKGYSHTFASRADVTRICANFYDVHGSNQVPNGIKEIQVTQNGDNSVGTNDFNLLNGTNCIEFPLSELTIKKVADDSQVNAGQQIGFKIEASNASTKTAAAAVVITDSLPKADGANTAGFNWKVDTLNGNCVAKGTAGATGTTSCLVGGVAGDTCTISGASGDAGQTLTCNIASIGTSVSNQFIVHVFSPTQGPTASPEQDVGANTDACAPDANGNKLGKTYTNKATASASSQDAAPDSSATVKVQCPSTILDKQVGTPATPETFDINVPYTFNERNDGSVALTAAQVIDDKCTTSPLTSPVQGDANNNGKLDPGETWKFSCTVKYTVNIHDAATGGVTFTNSATGQGTTIPTTGYTGGNVLVTGATPCTNDPAGTICDPDERDSVDLVIKITQ